MRKMRLGRTACAVPLLFNDWDRATAVTNDSPESTFLQSVIEAPYDDVPRQIYADWLEE